MNDSDDYDFTTALVDALVEEWVRAGVPQAVLSPGSRSAPLALALARASAAGRIGLDVLLDERSAAFFALGAAKASGLPVVMLCSSGTAAANFLPAIVEAHHGRVPLIACTADRPPELRDTGAGQAIDQLKIYGTAVNWSVEVGVPDQHPSAPSYWRSLANRSAAAAAGPPAGPVHLNFAFRDPLVPTGSRLADTGGRENEAPWTETIASSRLASEEMLQRLIELTASCQAGVLVCGWGTEVPSAVVERFVGVLGWPVLADPLSGLRQGTAAITTYDALLRNAEFAESHRPDFVVQLGAALTSKAATNWLSPDVPQLLVDPDGSWLDPNRAVRWRLVCDPADLLSRALPRLSPRADRSWQESWTRAEGVARLAIDRTIEAWPDLFEGRIARDVLAALPEGSNMLVASSMPVRDLESFAAARSGVRVHSNRGANGIDGFVSTALGIASASGSVVGLCGDLCFVHDSGGLLAAADSGLDALFIVIDNNGGGIFSFLPQARLPEHFEQLFGTPQNLDLSALIESLAIHVETVKEPAGLGSAIEDALRAGGPRVLLCHTERADNLAKHGRVFQAVDQALAQRGE